MEGHFGEEFNFDHLEKYEEMINIQIQSLKTAQKNFQNSKLKKKEFFTLQKFYSSTKQELLEIKQSMKKSAVLSQKKKDI